ncbi:MAG: hemin ABC transporter substrate-binding protein, partial [Alphaproteobacteria bacterium]|nr:hemin ABC transporter substrate-binding protein [Alphaproteobacteria bacterium]
MRNLLLAAALAVAGAVPAFAEPPQRIVVAGNGLTEIVYALGAGDRVAAVDTTSLYP